MIVGFLLIHAALGLQKCLGTVDQLAAGEALVRTPEFRAEAGDFMERPYGE